MSVANGRQLAPGVAEQLVRRAVGTTERGADETKQAAQLLGSFPTIVHRGLEVVVLDPLERRDGPFDLLVGDAPNGVGHLLLAVEGISHTGPLPGATPGNPETLSNFGQALAAGWRHRSTTRTRFCGGDPMDPLTSPKLAELRENRLAVDASCARLAV